MLDVLRALWLGLSPRTPARGFSVGQGFLTAWWLGSKSEQPTGKGRMGAVWFL